jgi:hypothetical protein
MYSNMFNEQVGSSVHLGPLIDSPECLQQRSIDPTSSTSFQLFKILSLRSNFVLHTYGTT